MFAIGRHHRVLRCERLHHAHRHRLLTVIEVHKATDLDGTVEFGALLFQAPDPQHLVQQVQGVGTLQRIAGCGV